MSAKLIEVVSLVEPPLQSGQKTTGPPLQPTNHEQSNNNGIKPSSDLSRLLFGIQLEVTSLLLEAERRKLNVLQRELQIALAEGGSIKAKEHQKQELIQAISKIQAQYDHLDKEYRQHALGAFRSSNTRGCGKRPRVWRPERQLGGVLRVRGGTVWFPAVGGLPLREDPGAAPPRGPRAASRLAEPSCPPDHTPQFGSTFGVGCPKREPDSPRPPPPAVRGGVQVLPPTLPPRTKPKPPLPPKRDELTRLTTVRREQPHRPPHADFPQDDTAESKRYETPETPPPFVQDKKSDDSYFQYDKNPERVSSPVWKLGDNVVEHVLRRNDSFHNRPHHSQGQLLSETNIHPGGDNSASRERAREPPANFEDRLTVESKVNFLENLERQNSARKNPPKDTPPETVNGQVNSRPPVTKSEALPPPPPPEPDPSDYPECLYATINPETKRHHAAEKQSAEDKKPVYAEPVPPPPPPSETFSEASDDSRREDDREESSDSEEGATADIWVRAIDSPVKKPPGQVRNPSVETEQQKPDPKPHIVIENKDGGKVGSESLPCSRPSSRTASRSSSPALFCEKGGEKQSGSKQRISAAEALGVVAKPCPRPPPGNRMKNALEFRRQSLSNLSDSKLSVGSSATSQQLWSSFGECQEYRRHERTRGQSADSRTLQRLRAADGGASTPPAWDNYSSTLSRIGKYAKSSERAATTGGDRPKSTCSCGQHSVQPALPQPPPPPATVPREVGKRTFSVEELTTGRGDFVRGSSRSSLGKSPRVTFALSEDEMGAAGGGDPPRKPIRTSRPTQQDDRYFPHQSNRSQPAIGLKQTPKARSLRQKMASKRRKMFHKNKTQETTEKGAVNVEPRGVMEDTELQETVESILGKGARVVDCEKKSTVREEECLLVNGCRVALETEEERRLRDALLAGAVPDSAVLNKILIKAGVLSAPSKLETSLSVKSSVVTREQVTVARGGRVIDGRSRQTKQEDSFTSSELWEPTSPAGQRRWGEAGSTPDFTRVANGSSRRSEREDLCSDPWEPIKDPPLSSSASDDSAEDRPDFDLSNGLSKIRINGSPTIFGTVASDLTPKENSTCRRTLPQTTPSGLANGGDLPCTQEVNPSQDNSVVYRDGNLVSGRLEALVQHMVPTCDYYPDRAFLFAFLLTSRLFIKPHELLGQILAHCEAQQKAKQLAKERTQLISGLVQLLGEWSETFPYDFRDERVMSHVREVAHRCVQVEGPVRQEVSLLLHNLLHRLTKLEQYEAFLHSIHTEATTGSIEALSQNDVSELCGTAVCLAQQLTHIELERLSYIGPEEFVQAFAKESPNLETSFKDMKKTRNLESYVSWFNRLSYFVATEVCKHLKSKKQRVRVVEFWIETGRECFNIGNFNSLMAIIAGLNMSPVSRLKRTWAKVQGAKFSVLEHQMDPSCNFSSYRSTLKAAVWRSAAATDDSQRIVIPFFSLLVKDLYFLNEGCSNKLPNGHINFEKFWQLAKQVTEFITWKQVHCPFPKAPKVITYLQATAVLNEDGLSLASFECEPPDNHEKERYKALKADLST